ncbi:MAG: FtsX-like permease family protein, partial [Bacteroidota bacterium]
KSVHHHLVFTHPIMLKNYLLITWRTMLRNPFYAVLNILGLAICVAATLCIALYIHFELGYDSFHEKGERIYRLETRKIHTRERVLDVDWWAVPGNLGPIILQEYPGVEALTRIYSFSPGAAAKLENEDREYSSEYLYVVDSSVLDIFTLNLLYGDLNTALKGPGKVLLSESLSHRIFSEENPIGKVVVCKAPGNHIAGEKGIPLQVTGVYEDFPRNTHWLADGLISAETDPELPNAYFNSFGYPTYILPRTGVDLQSLVEKFSSIYERHLDKEREPVLVKAEHVLVPLERIHMEETNGESYLFIFGTIGFLILAIAIISYVNLTIAKRTQRAKEIGVRKVLGSNRKELIGQFLVESLTIACISTLLGIICVSLGIEFINSLLSIHLDAGKLLQPNLILIIGAIFLAVGIGGGIHPAYFLSSFSVTDELKGQNGSSGNQNSLRRMLIGIQFAIVIFVLVSTGMVYEQLSYIQHKHLGFDKNHVVRMALPVNIKHRQVAEFQTTLQSHPSIQSTCQANFLPGTGNMVRSPISVETPEGPVQQYVRRGRIGTDYFESMDIALTLGRNFSSDHPTDSVQSAIINKRLAGEFDLEDPIGTKIRLGDKNNPNYLLVVGVIEDVHESALHEPIQPQLYRLGDPLMPYVLVRLGKNPHEGLEVLEEAWIEAFPEAPFEFRFVDEIIQEEYLADKLRGKIFLLFSLLTVFLSFLGLFGLASYLSQQRIKEIGIRRVLGANLLNVMVVLTKGFLLTLLAASLPAFAGAWFFSRDWLANFSFQAEMNYFLYVQVLIAILMLVLVTVGIHAWRTSRINPIQALKAD